VEQTKRHKSLDGLGSLIGCLRSDQRKVPLMFLTDTDFSPSHTLVPRHREGLEELEEEEEEAEWIWQRGFPLRCLK
jgi:hypothetical protein